jgi:hypothetical protein
MIKFRDIYKPVSYRNIDIDIEYLEEWVDHFNVDLDPDYQRGHVWTKEQREAFVGFVLQGGSPPPIYINNLYVKQGYKEVIDGKQRIVSLLKWLNGDIPAALSTGLKVWREELDHCKNLSISSREVELDRKGVLEFYLLLNGGGTVHSEEELQRVRYLLLTTI